MGLAIQKSLLDCFIESQPLAKRQVLRASEKILICWLNDSLIDSSNSTSPTTNISNYGQVPTTVINKPCSPSPIQTSPSSMIYMRDTFPVENRETTVATTFSSQSTINGKKNQTSHLL
jgi:hypothetical protein